MTKARDIASAIPAPSTVSSAELGYLDGVTSAIQTQIDSKIGSASAINPTIVDAKGDIIAATAADTVARLAVGANGTVLTAASGQATGLQWASASAAGSSYTLLNSGGTNLSGSTTTISSISGQEKLLILITGASSSSAASYFHMTINGDTGTKYDYAGQYFDVASTYATSNFGPYDGYGPNFPIGVMSGAAGSTVAASIAINGGTGTGGKQFQMTNGGTATGSSGARFITIQGVYQGTATISSVEVVTSGGTFDAGKIWVYGSAV